MSGHKFHVHGPHDHEIEYIAQHGGDIFTSRIAVLTAVLTTIGAIFAYLGGHAQNAALLYKNEAAIQKTAAANKWSHYQAKSTKQSLAELSATLTTGETQKHYSAAIERYKAEKDEIKLDAERLEHEASLADHESGLEMQTHQRWELATMLLQIAIAMSAITLLTKKRWMLFGVFSSSAIGIVFGILAYSQF